MVAHRLPLFLNKLNMMRDVGGHFLNQGFQRQRPGLGMDAPALEVFGLERAKNPGDMLADRLDEHEFLFGNPDVVGQPCGK